MSIQPQWRYGNAILPPAWRKENLKGPFKALHERLTPGVIAKSAM